jgi:hypothetical protein
VIPTASQQPAAPAYRFHAPVIVPTNNEAERALFPETTRADAWIEQMQRRERERRIGGRWYSTIASAGLGTVVGVALALDQPSGKEARAIMGAGIAPMAAAVAFGLFLPEEHATPWASAAFSLGMATFSAGLSFPWDGDTSEISRDERNAEIFFGATLASQFVFFIPLAFMDRGLGRRAYAEYFVLPAQERPRAALGLLIESDQQTRAKAGVMLLGSLLTMSVAGAGAAISDDPIVLLAGMPALVGTLTGLIPFLFRESRLEMFVRGELPKPGGFHF